MSLLRTSALVLFACACAFAQAPNDPFPKPINAADDVIKVGFVEFAALPDLGGQHAITADAARGRAGHAAAVRQRHARPALHAPLDGKTVTLYLDINDASGA